MKLNNKGFAITSVLYGLLILFVSLVGTYLAILVSKMNRLSNISEDINDSYGFNKQAYEESVNIWLTFPYTAQYTGKYKFKAIINDEEEECTSYLSKSTEITSDFSEVTFVESYCNENNISGIYLTQIWYNGDDASE